MQWARGFTLLHWAAKHDAADLCARFLAQGADPYHKDDSGKSAFDYANDKRAVNAIAQLEKEPPKESPHASIVGSEAWAQIVLIRLNYEANNKSKQYGRSGRAGPRNMIVLPTDLCLPATVYKLGSTRAWNHVVGI